MSVLSPHLAGHCPHGCGETLWVGDGGRVVCADRRCPDPNAVDSLLHEPTEHLVSRTGGTIWVEHPLRERQHRVDECSLLPEHSSAMKAMLLAREDGAEFVLTVVDGVLSLRPR